MKKHIWHLGCFIAALMLFSCGYRLEGGGSLPGRPSNVAVKMFKNKSAQIGAEAAFTNALINELLENAKVKIVNQSYADCVIHGRVTSVILGALTRSSDDSVNERQVTASVDVEMKNQDGKTIFSVSGFSHSEVFSVRQDNENDEAAEKKAVEKIADRVAQRLVSQMMDNF